MMPRLLTPTPGSGKFATAVVDGISNPTAKVAYRPRVPANPKHSWSVRAGIYWDA